MNKITKINKLNKLTIREYLLQYKIVNKNYHYIQESKCKNKKFKLKTTTDITSFKPIQ